MKRYNKINLWNLQFKKTRQVIQFIETLQYQKSFSKREKQRFDNIQSYALNKIQPDDMLSAIGFTNDKFLPNIYNWCLDRENEQK